MEEKIIFLLLVVIAVIYSLYRYNQLCLVTAVFGFRKKWFGFLRKGIYKGRMVEVFLPIGIQVFFNDYSKSNFSYKEYFCLTKKNLLKKEGVITEQLSAKLKLDLENFIIQYNNKYERSVNSAIRLCAYNRSIFFSRKYGTVLFYVPGKVFEDQNLSRQALDIAVEAAKEMEKILRS